MSYKIAICDDLMEHSTEVEKIILDMYGAIYSIDNYNDPLRLVSNIKAGDKYNILFLDNN